MTFITARPLLTAFSHCWWTVMTFVSQHSRNYFSSRWFLFLILFWNLCISLSFWPIIWKICPSLWKTAHSNLQRLKEDGFHHWYFETGQFQMGGANTWLSHTSWLIGPPHSASAWAAKLGFVLNLMLEYCKWKHVCRSLPGSRVSGVNNGLHRQPSETIIVLC